MSLSSENLAKKQILLQKQKEKQEREKWDQLEIEYLHLLQDLGNDPWCFAQCPQKGNFTDDFKNLVHPLLDPSFNPQNWVENFWTWEMVTFNFSKINFEPNPVFEFKSNVWEGDDFMAWWETLDIPNHEPCYLKSFGSDQNLLFLSESIPKILPLLYGEGLIVIPNIKFALIYDPLNNIYPNAHITCAFAQ
jgi:hypothetical protein